MIQEIAVDLKRPPQERWRLSSSQCAQARELLGMYNAAEILNREVSRIVLEEAQRYVPRDYWQEMEALAAQIGVSTEAAIFGNVYYSALKITLFQAFGCTAFALDTPRGVLHARNLDWWTDKSALTWHTALCHFSGGPAGDFTVVGWPGFAGVLSAVAPGRFAVSLNAVSSLDPPQPAIPVEFLLRQVLETAKTFAEALSILSETPIPCDCLLLLSGVGPGEMAVIERAPNRYAIRRGADGWVCATNDYLALGAKAGHLSAALDDTCCSRTERVGHLMQRQRPESEGQCFKYLSDSEIRMRITVQQMVFRAATGDHWVRLPE